MWVGWDRRNNEWTSASGRSGFHQVLLHTAYVMFIDDADVDGGRGGSDDSGGVDSAAGGGAES